MNSNCLPCF